MYLDYNMCIILFVDLILGEDGRMVEHDEARRWRLHFDGRHCCRTPGTRSLLLPFKNQGKRLQPG